MKQAAVNHTHTHTQRFRQAFISSLLCIPSWCSTMCFNNCKKKYYMAFLSLTHTHTGWLGSAAELPPGVKFHGRADGHAGRDGQHPRKFPPVDDHRGAPPLSHHAAADGHQIHQRTTTGPQSRTQEDLRRSEWMDRPRDSLNCFAVLFQLSDAMFRFFSHVISM